MGDEQVQTGYRNGCHPDHKGLRQYLPARLKSGGHREQLVRYESVVASSIPAVAAAVSAAGLGNLQVRTPAATASVSARTLQQRLPPILVLQIPIHGFCQASLEFVPGCPLQLALGKRGVDRDLNSRCANKDLPATRIFLC
jgi:hypothetical protein